LARAQSTNTHDGRRQLGALGANAQGRVNIDASATLRRYGVHADALAAMPLACVHREYPNKVAHVLRDDADAKPPRELTPAFYGCFDWHSAVHGHWTLARLLRTCPGMAAAPEARAALSRSLTDTNIAGEVAYAGRADRLGFERPYGLAWLLVLALELDEWNDAEAQTWAAALEPLTRLAAASLRDWLPKLAYPIRSGEHTQTAFAMGLALDWARGSLRADPERAKRAGAADLAALLETRALDFHGEDRDAPIDREPSGHDFLSPCLAEADLVRRVLAPPQFAGWLARFLPRLSSAEEESAVEPVTAVDRADGKLVHLDGLSLSRAWMLEGISSGLPLRDPRRASLEHSAEAHARAGLRALALQSYEGAHWLGTFAVYLLTRRGI
jgi:hypothetical protein